MAGKNGRTPHNASDDDLFEDDEENEENIDGVDDEDYDAMMLLDQLESLEEEMMELGVTTLDELRARIRDIHAQMND